MLRDKLRAGLKKQSQYVTYDDEEEEKPWWRDALVGAGLGAGIGAGVGGVTGALRGRQHYLDTARDIHLQLTDPENLPLYQNPVDQAGRLNPHLQAMEDRLVEAGTTPYDAAWQGGLRGVPRGALWGAGIGATAGALRTLLSRVLQRNRGRRRR